MIGNDSLYILKDQRTSRNPQLLILALCFLLVFILYLHFEQMFDCLIAGMKLLPEICFQSQMWRKVFAGKSQKKQ